MGQAVIKKEDIIDGDKLVFDENYQSIPFVAETENKFLRDDNTFVDIPTPAGGYANNLYLGEIASDVPTYKILTYTPDIAETIKTVTAKASDGVVTAQTFLYPSGVSVANFPSGLWSLKLWGNISATAGVSQVGFTYFRRSILEVETDLFTAWSEDIGNLVNSWIDVVVTQPSYVVEATDRMGLRLVFKTSSTSNKTLTYAIGDGYAAFLNNPNMIRHSQLRAKNDELSYQHIDQTTEKETIVDADSLTIWDSVALKFVRTTFAHFKTVLATVFESKSNKQNSLATDGTGNKYATVDAVNTGLNALKKVCSVQVLSGTSAWALANGKAYIRIPSALNGMNLVMCGMSVVTKSTSGTPTVQLSRGRQATATDDFTFVSMLSTPLTIDANEYDSKDATAYVIDTTKDDVATGDIIRVDLTAIGTGTKGLNLTLTFSL